MVLSASAVLGLLLAFAGVGDGLACASHRSTSGRQHEDLSEAGLVRESRGLIDGEWGVPEPDARICGTTARSESEAMAFADMIDQFYAGSQGGNRHLKAQTIEVAVNFVSVQHTDGRGATPQQVDDQIAHLNAAFAPEFHFNLANARSVTDDNYFLNVDADDPDEIVEKQMKMQYKIGGKETLSVYSLSPKSNDGLVGGWAYGPSEDAGILDGAVVSYDSVPGGGDSYWSEGDVSSRSGSAWRVAGLFQC
jgi:hypothetical protein